MQGGDNEFRAARAAIYRHPEKRNDGTIAQRALDAGGMGVVPSALKDLDLNEWPNCRGISALRWRGGVWAEL
jgi:hypothetical protein